MKVKGEFEVKLNELKGYAEGKEGITLGRSSLDKIFHGKLSGESKGEMLSAFTPTKGSAGYVAIEQFTGDLEGKTGSFVLQHFGTMAKGEERLILEVVPDSGTGDLSGISGKMKIIRDNGKHFYEFEYQLSS